MNDETRIEGAEENAGNDTGEAWGYPYSCQEVLAQIEEDRTAKKSWTSNILMLGISLLIFFNLGLLKNGVSDLVIIIGVLIVHEMGHLLAMRMFGYRNIQMFFIPFFGAAVTGRSRNVAAWKKAIVTLMGPIPGLVLALVFGIIYLRTNTPGYDRWALMFFAINLFNLLPFMPLDGGRFLWDVLFLRNRYLEVIFRIISALCLVAAGYFMQSWILAGFGVISLLGSRYPFKIARIANEIKQTATQTDFTEDEIIPIEAAKDIISKVHKSLSEKANLKTVAGFTQQIWERMCYHYPGVFATVGLISLYLFSILIGIIVSFGFTAAWALQKNETKIVQYQEPDGHLVLKEQRYFNGKFTSEIDLAPGGLLYDGNGVSYNEDGTISKEGRWNLGKWDGEWKFYDHHGKVIRITVFDKGRFVIQKEWDGSKWVEKEFNDLPFLLRRVCIKHFDSVPSGPKTDKKKR